MNLNLIADRLDRAALAAQAVEQISQEEEFNLQMAYAIQSISLSKRYRRGDNWVGLKMGFTSKAKMAQMGVHDMIWGRLTSEMYYPNGGALSIRKFIHPRAEPEIAFRIGKNIDKVLDVGNAMEYVDGLAIAVEIIDSRYRNFKFSLEDVVADNCSSAGFSYGKWLPTSTNIQNIRMNLSIDGEVKQQGSSSAILGNPIESLVAATRLAQENGENITAGAIILAGAATPAEYLKAGQSIKVEAEGLGDVSLIITS